MNSKSQAMHLLLVAIAAVLAMTPSSASCKTDTVIAPSTVDLTLTALNSPVLPRLALSNADQPPYLAQTGEEGGQPVDVYGFKRKSPTRAFLQSFVIPGWGQFYAKSSFWKPIMFVGFEAATWAGYVSFNGKGHDKEDEYRVYADAHWDSLSYITGLYEVFYSRDYPPSIKNAWLDTTTYLLPPDAQGNQVAQSFSHHAWFKEDGARVERDEYYENIGKYNQFNFGWDDFIDPDLDSIPFTRVSPNRAKYLQMRDDANSEFSKANTMLVATVANHLLAGFWAALDARAFNRAQDQFSHLEPNLQLVRSPSNPQKYMPYLTMKYRF